MTTGPIDQSEAEEMEHRYVMQTYMRAPVTFVSGEGSWLYDSEGKKYLDFLSGISVTSIGHSHPSVMEAVRRQSGELVHASNLFYTEPMLRLAKRLSESSLGGRVFLCNSGTEANECAIKIARKHAHSRGVTQPEIVSFDGDFHGRTYGSLSATPRLARSSDFAPMLPGFRTADFDDPAGLDAVVGDSTAAILIEPIQGESGVWPLSEETLRTARAACDRTGALLILDEIQTGMGRCGSLWAYEQTAVRPDLITTGKALGGGMAMAACIASPQSSGVLEPGDHGSTFAGGPMTSAASLATLDVIDDPALLRSVREHGSLICDRLSKIPSVREVRGRGLMLGVGLEEGVDARAVNAALLEAGLIANAPTEHTIRLLPPLNVDQSEVELGLEIMSDVLMREHTA